MLRARAGVCVLAILFVRQKIREGLRKEREREEMGKDFWEQKTKK